MKIRTLLHLALLAAVAAMVASAVAVSWLCKNVRGLEAEQIMLVCWVILFASLATVFLAIWSARSILSRSLQRLLAAIEEIGRGNLKHRIGVMTGNEVGMLSQAIDQMTEWLQRVTASRDELAQAERQQRLSARALDSAAECMLIVQYGKIVAVNRAFRIVTGYSANEVIGKSVHMLHVGVPDVHRLAERRAALARSGIWQGEIWGRRKDGEIYPAWVSLSLVKEESGNCYVSMFSDISTEKNEEIRLNYLAFHDALTDLPNRVLMQQRLSDMLARARRRGGTVALLYIDLDHFKPINDVYGHEIGDVLLQETARRLRACVRKTDIVARLGGDEFVVLLDGLRDAEEASWIAQNLLDSLAWPFALRNAKATSRSSTATLILPPASVTVSASLGISCFPHDGDTPEDLLRNADAAMYVAKQDGKNSYRFFSSGMDREVREQSHLAAALRTAMENKELTLVYQPCVSAKSGRMLGVEALIRWHSPVHGMILPGRFIGLAEEIGVIEPIAEWVLHAACAQLRSWQGLGDVPQFVSVNLSASQFYQEGLAELVASIVSEAGIEPQSLELEVSESVVMAHPERACKTLARLASIGVGLALDDFGISNLPLIHLQGFSINRIKIDNSLVSKLPGDFDYANLVRAIIAIGDSLKLGITAEGVETEEQCRFLLSAGCDAMQGYLFSKPLAPQALEAYSLNTIPAYH